jgi:hypothetical protein
MAFSQEQTIQIYEDLADGYDRHHQPRMRDLFLMLAADACLRSSQGDKAELFRRRLLDLNPNHRLKPYASFAEACQYPEMKRELEELRAKYPPEVAQQLLESLWELHDEGEQTGALPPRAVSGGPRPLGMEPPVGVPMPPEPYGAGPKPPAEEDEEEATLMGSAKDFLSPRSPPPPDVLPRPGSRPRSEADAGHPPGGAAPPTRPAPPAGGLPRSAAVPPVPPPAAQPFNVPLPPPPQAVPPRSAPPRSPRAAEEGPRGYRVPEVEQTQPPPRRPPLPREPAEDEIRQSPRRPAASGQPPTSLGAAPAPRPAPPVLPLPAAPRPVSAPLPAPLPEPRYAPPLPASSTTPEEPEHPGAWVSTLLFLLTLVLALALTGLTLVWPLL